MFLSFPAYLLAWSVLLFQPAAGTTAALPGQSHAERTTSEPAARTSSGTTATARAKQRKSTASDVGPSTWKGPSLPQPALVRHGRNNADSDAPTSKSLARPRDLLVVRVGDSHWHGARSRLTGGKSRARQMPTATGTDLDDDDDDDDDDDALPPEPEPLPSTGVSLRLLSSHLRSKRVAYPAAVTLCIAVAALCRCRRACGRW